MTLEPPPTQREISVHIDTQQMMTMTSFCSGMHIGIRCSMLNMHHDATKHLVSGKFWCGANCSLSHICQSVHVITSTEQTLGKAVKPRTILPLLVAKTKQLQWVGGLYCLCDVCYLETRVLHNSLSMCRKSQREQGYLGKLWLCPANKSKKMLHNVLNSNK